MAKIDLIEQNEFRMKNAKNDAIGWIQDCKTLLAMMHKNLNEAEEALRAEPQVGQRDTIHYAVDRAYSAMTMTGLNTRFDRLGQIHGDFRVAEALLKAEADKRAKA